MSSDFLCPLCKRIHSYRMSFCPTDARNPTAKEIEEDTYFSALRDNDRIEHLNKEINRIKGQE